MRLIIIISHARHSFPHFSALVALFPMSTVYVIYDYDFNQFDSSISGRQQNIVNWIGSRHFNLGDEIFAAIISMAALTDKPASHLDR